MRTALQEQLANEILSALAAGRMTQKELAMWTGLTEKHVSRVLRGRDDGSLETWQSFASALRRSWEVRLA